MFKFKYCDKEFSSKQKLGGHTTSHFRIKKIKEIIKKEYKCRYCDKEFLTSKKLGGHVSCCKLNPIYKERIERISLKRKGRPLSEDQKEKARNTIKKKIEEGTWHYSFSKSRTHEYKGTKFHGMWEVSYAKWLDSNNIKWIRPKETFKYVFENIERTYNPDFYLIDEDCYVEIKGYKTPKDEAKWKSFPHKLKILRGKDLFELNLIKDYKEV